MTVLKMLSVESPRYWCRNLAVLQGSLSIGPCEKENTIMKFYLVLTLQTSDFNSCNQM